MNFLYKVRLQQHDLAIVDEVTEWVPGGTVQSCTVKACQAKTAAYCVVARIGFGAERTTHVVFRIGNRWREWRLLRICGWACLNDHLAFCCNHELFTFETPPREFSGLLGTCPT